MNSGNMKMGNKNGYWIIKYAIYAYTHGPVTGSGPSVVTLLATTY